MTFEQLLADKGFIDPAEYGRSFADGLGGVEGAHPRDITPTIEGMASALRVALNDAGVFPQEYVDIHTKCFEYSAKARYFDIYMGFLAHEGEA